ncbi:MAG TPA: hypothetical protein VJ124_05380 [Pyrinomonadaceae bacterium]|nr:hypothetical protein [Pyrinomonadaceae bacterium]
MKKVDRLGWAVGFSLTTYGIRVGVRSNDPSGLERICDRLPSEWKESSLSVVDRLYSIIIGGQGQRNFRRFNLLYGDHVRLARSVEADDVFDTFESDLRLTVAEFARHRVFVHAGVVGWKGRAIIIPGRSYSGKSTLIAELVRAGATYYSDEYAVFDSQGRVHPFKKALELRSAGEVRQTRVEVEQLGGQSGEGPLPVQLVVVTQFKDGARWRPRRLSGGPGILQLFSHTVSARRSPERALTALQNLAQTAEFLRGPRGEASEIARTILKRAEQKK